MIHHDSCIELLLIMMIAGSCSDKLNQMNGRRSSQTTRRVESWSSWLQQLGGKISLSRTPLNLPQKKAWGNPNLSKSVQISLHGASYAKNWPEKWTPFEYSIYLPPDSTRLGDKAAAVVCLTRPVVGGAVENLSMILRGLGLQPWFNQIFSIHPNCRPLNGEPPNGDQGLKVEHLCPQHTMLSQNPPTPA